MKDSCKTCEMCGILTYDLMRISKWDIGTKEFIRVFSCFPCTVLYTPDRRR